MNWTLVILGLNIVVLSVIYILLKRRIDRSFRSTELLSQIEIEIDRVITELNQTTERNISLVENKISSLNLLIAQADKRLLIYNRKEENQLTNKPIVYTKPVVRQKVQNHDDKSKKNGPLSSVKNESSEVRKSSKERVLELYSGGIDVNTIASKLNITHGEIDLILSMNKRKTMMRQEDE